MPYFSSPPSQKPSYEEPSPPERGTWEWYASAPKNLLKDAEDFAQGMIALAGLAVTFPYKAATGQIDWEAVPGQAKDVFNAMVEDLSQWKDPVARIVEHPGVALSDVLGVAGGVGWGAKALGGMGIAGKTALLQQGLKAAALGGGRLEFENLARQAMQLSRMGAGSAMEELQAGAKAANLAGLSELGAKTGQEILRTTPALPGPLGALGGLMEDALKAKPPILPVSPGPLETPALLGKTLKEAGSPFLQKTAEELLQEPGVALRSKLIGAGSWIDPADLLKNLGRMWKEKGWSLPLLGTAEEFGQGKFIQGAIGEARGQQFAERNKGIGAFNEALKGLKPQEQDAFIRRTQFLEPFEAQGIPAARAGELEAIVQKLASVVESYEPRLGEAGTGLSLGDKALNKMGLLEGKIPVERAEMSAWRPFAQARGLIPAGQDMTPEILQAAKDLATKEGRPNPVYMPQRLASDIKGSSEYMPTRRGELPSVPQEQKREGWLISSLNEQTRPPGTTAPAAPPVAGVPAGAVPVGGTIPEYKVAKDVPELYRRYASHYARYDAAKDLVGTIAAHKQTIKLPYEEFYRDYKNRVPEGMAVLAPEGLVQFYKGMINIGDEAMGLLENAAKEGLDIKNLLASSGAELQAKLEELAAKHISFIGAKHPEYVYLIPKKFSEELAGAAATRGIPREIWDRLTSWWRAGVLSLTPRWTVNEAAGTTFLLAAKGISPTGIAANLLAGKDIVPERVLLGGMTRGMGTEAQLSQKAAQSLSGKIVTGLEQSLPGKAIGGLSEFGKSINAFVEDNARQLGYVDEATKEARKQLMMEMGQGAFNLDDIIQRAKDFKADPEMVSKLMGEVDKYVYNYMTKLTPWERQVMRSYFPFYGFWKHILELQARFPLEHPMKQAVTMRIAQTAASVQKQMMEEATGVEGQQPQNRGDIPLFETPGGEQVVFNARGMYPGPRGFTDIIGGSGFLPGIHPAATIAIERATGTNWFTKRPFKEENTVNVGGFKWEYDPKTGQINPINVIAPPLPEHILGQFPQYKLFNDVTSPIIKYSPGIAAGTETEEEVRSRKAIEAAFRFSGINVRDANVQDWMERMLKSRSSAAKYFIKQAEAQKLQEVR